MNNKDIKEFHDLDRLKQYSPLPSGLTVADSRISGQGLFTTRRLVMGTLLGISHYRIDEEYIIEQIEKAVTGTKFAGYKFQNRYKDMDAYTKKTVMGKAFVKVNDTQDLELSLTANRSDDVLYGNSKMDALYDDSDIFNVDFDGDGNLEILLSYLGVADSVDVGGVMTLDPNGNRVFRLAE